MLQISNGVGMVVAADAQTSFAAVDAAVMAHGKLCSSIVEASNASKLPIITTQKLLESMSAGLSGLIASRSDLAAAIRELTVIQAKSSLNETSFGCADGLPPLKGEHTTIPTNKISAAIG